MRILFVHQNFPGQYRHLAPALAARGHEVRSLGMSPLAAPLAGVQAMRYGLARGNTPGIHPWVQDIETKVLRGEACVAAAARLDAADFRPDLICVHPGWGEALFLRELWPQARQLHFVEFFYAAEGQDVGFDPEFGTVDLAMRCRLATKNLALMQALVGMDAGISPTRWQAGTVPQPWRDRIEVIHDGIDTAYASPDNTARFRTTSQAGTVLDLGADDEVLSFVNRNLEPSRGYHRFMRALPELLRRRPRAQAVIVGGNDVSYGARPAAGSHQQIYLDEVREALGADGLARVHFVGKVPHRSLIDLFRIARAHVYLSYPFVLSWSLLEAMACGMRVIGSDTAPVREVIDHGETGWLVDFFDTAALVEASADALARPRDADGIGVRARARVLERYDLQRVCLPRQIALAERVGAG
ncbi:glycosyltransferase [Leptothrix discophora]|uniref:Glycosyltransferase n=1 Tax=Leptothrix discophora TaxID=89 RepID=A0ABT9G2S6_LEPDI|nr:glycosyltransferase [Leptothrix discophora]MDP4300784.1 glycosyltransferase [Leptothrix discophora]